MQNQIMTTRRMHVVRALVLALAVIPTFMLVAPATSHAAPNPGYFYTGVNKSDPAALTATQTTSFSVGDCVSYSGELRLQTPSFGKTTLTWHQFAYTNYTTNADIWHGTFSFLNSAGQTLLKSPELHGTAMPQIGQIYEWRVPAANLALGFFSYSTIAQVLWKGSC
jgi:hypothetical protein